MKHLFNGKYLLAMLFSLFLLASCGGGGDSGVPATTTPAAPTTLTWNQNNWDQVNWQ